MSIYDYAAVTFAIRTSRRVGNPARPTGKPDGMFIRKKDALFTDHKPSAMSFMTEHDAVDFLANWKILHPEVSNYPYFLVQVESELIVKKQIKILKQL